MGKLISYVLACIALILLAMVAVQTGMSWTRDIYYVDFVSGVWSALADDLKNGVFYRPAFGELGYGASRYFPLYSVILTLGGDPLKTGVAVSVFSVALLLSGVYHFLRNTGNGMFLSAMGGAFVLASSSSQFALINFRPDCLAAALNIWALAVCTRSFHKKRNLLLAALLFTLAFATKLTALYAAAGALLWLLISKQFNTAGKLFLWTAIGCLLVLIGMYVGSDGRAFQVLGTGYLSGLSLKDAVTGPLHFLYVMVTYDPGCLMFFLLASAAWLAMIQHMRFELPVCFFLAAVLITVLILSKIATDFNHLIDLQAASVILLFSWIASSEKRNAFPAFALIIAGLISLQPPLYKIRQDAKLHTRNLSEFVNQLGQETQGPILAENPLIPILAGQRPYVVDPWRCRIIREHYPTMAEPLLAKLRSREFGAVVLESDPRTEFGREFLKKYHFGEGFVEELEKNYGFYEKVGRQIIYLASKEGKS